jgi:hypothetical protein
MDNWIKGTRDNKRLSSEGVGGGGGGRGCEGWFVAGVRVDELSFDLGEILAVAEPSVFPITPCFFSRASIDKFVFEVDDADEATLGRREGFDLDWLFVDWVVCIAAITSSTVFTLTGGRLDGFFWGNPFSGPIAGATEGMLVEDEAELLLVDAVRVARRDARAGGGGGGTLSFIALLDGGDECNAVPDMVRSGVIGGGAVVGGVGLEWETEERRFDVAFNGTGGPSPILVTALVDPFHPPATLLPPLLVCGNTDFVMVVLTGEVWVEEGGDDNALAIVLESDDELRASSIRTDITVGATDSRLRDDVGIWDDGGITLVDICRCFFLFDISVVTILLVFISGWDVEREEEGGDEAESIAKLESSLETVLRDTWRHGVLSEQESIETVWREIARWLSSSPVASLNNCESSSLLLFPDISSSESEKSEKDPRLLSSSSSFPSSWSPSPPIIAEDVGLAPTLPTWQGEIVTSPVLDAFFVSSFGDASLSGKDAARIVIGGLSSESRCARALDCGFVYLNKTRRVLGLGCGVGLSDVGSFTGCSYKTVSASESACNLDRAGAGGGMSVLILMAGSFVSSWVSASTEVTRGNDGGEISLSSLLTRGESHREGSRL